MFVVATDDFLKFAHMGGEKKLLPVQIKSSDRKIKSFVHDPRRAGRFFNLRDSIHQFVLCGMDEKDLILADIIGQLVVHLSGLKISEEQVLGWLDKAGDIDAVRAYQHQKVMLLFRWYGTRLPHLK